MSIIARQSTARTVMVGPVLDADGVAVTDGVVGDLKISKNGGAPAALNGSATLTHRNTGHYSLALTTSDLDTVGQAEIVIDDTVNAMPVKVVTVIEEAVYDALFVASATGLLPANVTQFAGSAITSAAGIPEVKVASIAANAITATAIASDAITDAKVASDVTIASVTGAVGSVTAGVTLANDAITAAKFDETTAFPLGAADTGATQVARVGADGDTLETLSDQLDAKASQASVDDLPTNAELATSQAAADDATLAAIAALNNLSAAQVNAEVDTALADIHLDHLLAVTYDPANKPGAADALLNELVESDAGVARYTANALEQAPTGGSAPSAADIADAVWEEDLTDHSGTVGSTAEALGAAGSAGDPWTTALPGAYGSGSAGKIIGDNINATISSRATQTSVDDLPTNAELATSQAAADDATLAAIAALNNLSAAQVNAEVDTAIADVGLTTTITGRIDAAVSTRATPAQVATELGTYDAPTKAELDAAVATLATAANLATLDTVADAILALLDDARGEPGQGAPPASADMATKVDYLYKLLRNKITQNATTLSVFADDGTTVDHKATVSDDGTTYTRGELATGP